MPSLLFLHLHIAGFLKSNQQEYYGALAGVQLKEKWSEWVIFFATAVEESVKESINIAIELEAILKRWESKVSELRLRSDSVVNRLPKLLVGTPVVSARQMEVALGVSFPAANNALAKLVELGLLTTPENQQRYRLFVAREVIDLLNRDTSNMYS